MSSLPKIDLPFNIGQNSKIQPEDYPYLSGISSDIIPRAPSAGMRVWTSPTGNIYQLQGLPLTRTTTTNRFGVKIPTGITGGVTFNPISIKSTTSALADTSDSTTESRLAMRPDLVPYTGATSVGLTPEQLSALDIINKIVTGDLGSLQQSLFGPLERTVLGPARRSLTDQVLPALNEVFSGGPTGSLYNTGGRRAAQERALTEFGETSARLRAEQPTRKLGEAIQGLGAEDITRQNTIQNIERDMQVHYANQGLTEREFNMDLAAINSALSESQFDWQRYIGQEQLNYQNQAQAMEMWSLNQQLQQIADANKAANSGIFGQILGMIPGLVTGNPFLAMGGSQLGGGLGQTFGGSPLTGYSGIASGLETAYLPRIINYLEK